MVGIVGKTPNGSVLLNVIILIPFTVGSPYSWMVMAPLVPDGAEKMESYFSKMALEPFPFRLFPVYAYQCERSPVAKLIFTGQVCAWGNDRRHINRNKPLNLHFIRHVLLRLKKKNLLPNERIRVELNRLVLRNLR